MVLTLSIIIDDCSQTSLVKTLKGMMSTWLTTCAINLFLTGVEIGWIQGPQERQS
jgi:hypothetical protein